MCTFHLHFRPFFFTLLSKEFLYALPTHFGVGAAQVVLNPLGLAIFSSHALRSLPTSPTKRWPSGNETHGLRTRGRLSLNAILKTLTHNELEAATLHGLLLCRRRERV